MRQDSVLGCLSIVILAFIVLGLIGVMSSEDTGKSQEADAFGAFCACGVCPIVVVGVVAGAAWVGRQQSQSVRRRPPSLITSEPLVEPLDVADLAMDGVVRLNYEPTGPSTPHCPSRLLDYLWSRGFRLSRSGVGLSYFQASAALTAVDGMSDPSLILATLNDADYRFVHFAGPVSDAVALATLRDAVVVCR